MELKPEEERKVAEAALGFNRTFMELKLAAVTATYLKGTVLIGPSWN